MTNTILTDAELGEVWSGFFLWLRESFFGNRHDLPLHASILQRLQIRFARAVAANDDVALADLTKVADAYNFEMSAIMSATLRCLLEHLRVQQTPEALKEMLDGLESMTILRRLYEIESRE